MKILICAYGNSADMFSLKASLFELKEKNSNLDIDVIVASDRVKTLNILNACKSINKIISTAECGLPSHMRWRSVPRQILNKYGDQYDKIIDGSLYSLSNFNQNTSDLQKKHMYSAIWADAGLTEIRDSLYFKENKKNTHGKREARVQDDPHKIRGVLMCGVGNVLFQIANITNAATAAGVSTEFGYVDMSRPAKGLAHRQGHLFHTIFLPWGGHKPSKWSLAEFFPCISFSPTHYAIDDARTRCAPSAESARPGEFCVVNRWTYDFINTADWKSSFKISAGVDAELSKKWQHIDWSRPVLHIRCGSKGDVLGDRVAYDVDALKWAFASGDPLILTDNPGKIPGIVQEHCTINKVYDILDTDDVLETLWLMTKAETLVLSRSTLSMWGAYLGSAKRVIIGPKFSDSWHTPLPTWEEI